MALIYLWGSDWVGGLMLLLVICLLLAHAAFVNWSERRGEMVPPRAAHHDG
jgi:hypothetical protein